MYNKKTPVDWVNTNIGTIGHLLKATKPTVMLPHGLMRIEPYTDPAITDRYFADKVQGFPIGNDIIMPGGFDVKKNITDWYSTYDHDLEEASPHYYSVELLSSNIKAECSVSNFSAIFRFSNAGRMLIVPSEGAEATWFDDVVQVKNTSAALPIFNTMHFNKSIVSINHWENSNIIELSFEDKGDLMLRAGISHVDMDRAESNLQKEIPDFNIDTVISSSKKAWNDLLQIVEVEGGSDDEKTVFYTALYRAHIRMTNYTEYGKYYSAYDGKVHDSDGQDFYTYDALWDTYRCMHPLQLLLDSDRQNDILQSYVKMYEQSGWMPSFPFPWGDGPVMLGFHAAAMFADSYYKGLRGFDIEKAYEGIKKNAMKKTMLPWALGEHTELDKCYLDKGFFPGLYPNQEEWVEGTHEFERRQSVSVTLEHAYDDWCIYRLAKALGKEDDAVYFKKRAKNYQKLYNSEIGFVAPKDADGNWITPYTPKWCGGQGGRDYFAENNAYIYNFHVQHDILGMAELMGGKKAMEEKLDNLYVEQYDGQLKSVFLHQYPDATGLIGQFPMGNEPSFHIPYMYNYTGSPWKTQKKVRENIRLWFTNSPYGICGDEDGGAMSAWLVMSAIGLYPVCPGRPIYDITSPLFDKVTIHLRNGKDFVISASGSNGKDKYIQSASLNGDDHDSAWISHNDIILGGELNLVMGNKPNYEWGSDAERVPGMCND